MPTRRWGSEKLVNTTTAGSQFDTRVATLADGRLLATWRTTGGSAITGQFLDSAGNPVGGELTLRASDAAIIRRYDVAAMADGGFYLVWSEIVGGVDYMLGRVFSASAAPVREQPVLFADTPLGDVRVAALGAGAVVAWEVDPATAALRVFDGAGAGGAINPLFQGANVSSSGIAVATAPGGATVALATAIDGSRGVAVVTKTPSGAHILAVQIAIATAGVSALYSPDLTWISASRAVVTWTESYSSFEYNSSDVKFSVLAMQAPGTPLVPVTDILTVNATQTGSQFSPQVVALPSGGFVIGWMDGGSFSGMVRLQAFDASGARVGGETTVNGNGVAGNQFRLSALADGRVAVSWMSGATLDGGSDGDGSSVRLQIIDPRDGIVKGTTASETLYGHDQVNDEISGYSGDDTLYGLRGDDALWGGPGADLLDGGRGIDDLHGGTGNDTHVLDTVDDTVFELGLQGNDTVQTGAFGVNLALYLNVENVTLTGALPLFATGNVTANILNGEGNSAANVLTGLQANDTYIVGVGDTVVEAVGGGTDTVQSASISLNLAGYAGVENIVLAGALPLSATGGTGDNAIDGERNSAANALTGLGGNDSYTVGLNDTVVEAAGGGTDTVQSATLHLNLALFSGVENAALLGAQPLTATGTAGPNTLDGAQNSAANVLTGLGGNDVYVLGPGDTAVEGPGGGTDQLQSALVSLDLANHANVEWIGLRGTLPLTARGGAGADILDGSNNSAANVLTGLGGNDTYVVGAGDTVVEAPGGGTDQVQSWSIGIDLALFANVENAALTWTQALNLTGTAAANVLGGNAAANVLTGNGGGDTFIGAGGTDTLIGGAGADMFRFLAPGDSAVGAGRDVIQAFTPAGGDRIDLAAIDANGALAGDPAFVFRGTAAFTGAAGELRYDVSGADVILQGTIAGGAPGFEIRVAGVGALAAGDLLL